MDDETVNPPATNGEGSRTELVKVPPRIPGLSRKQSAFVRAYVGEAGFNASEAVRQAYGYTDEHIVQLTVYRLNRCSRVTQAIGRRFNKLGMRAGELLGRLATEARGIPSECFTDEGDLDFPALKRRGLAHLVTSVTYDRKGRRTFRFVDPLQAQKIIAQHLGLLVDRVQIETTDFSQLTDEQLLEIARGR